MSFVCFWYSAIASSLRQSVPVHCADRLLLQSKMVTLWSKKSRDGLQQSCERREPQVHSYHQALLCDFNLTKINQSSLAFCLSKMAISLSLASPPNEPGQPLRQSSTENGKTVKCQSEVCGCKSRLLHSCSLSLHRASNKSLIRSSHYNLMCPDPYPGTPYHI